MYDHAKIENTWQTLWEEREDFVFKGETNPQKTCYVLEMFPYPSGRIHMGHVRNYVIGDVLARLKRAQGFQVLHPIGWDAFGLPAENAALERGVHPRAWTDTNIQAMKVELKALGLSWDWTREIRTCDPEYYGQEQRLFLDFLKAGFAYRKEAYVNWDPVENTVLANEQVVEGRGWRSGAIVEKRSVPQWFLRITALAEPLLHGLEGLSLWPHKVRTMQRHWIGRSEGARLSFEIVGHAPLEIFTTRPETLFGASFCALSPEHPLALTLAQSSPSVDAFLKEQRQTPSEETHKGCPTSLVVRHPLRPEATLPLWIAPFVTMAYGTGAIFGCPAHDERDAAFAQAHHLPVLPVVLPCASEVWEEGTMIHSEDLNGLTVLQARRKILERLGVSWGPSYRLRDWGVSRQRYWGCPLPIIHCSSCGAVPVPEKDLPVLLPEDVTYGQGNPLERHEAWASVPCPQCGQKARRETDTLDTFFDSSWYFARFCDPHNTEEPFAAHGVNAWLPVDHYIGGVEHAVMHLLYARFFTKVLHHMGRLAVDEPFTHLFTQGMVCHKTYKDEQGRWLYPSQVSRLEGHLVHKDTGLPAFEGRSEKMSKSKKNTVDPQRIVTTYGADATRFFILSDTPPERDFEWTDTGVEGAKRFLSRVWRLSQAAEERQMSGEEKHTLHKTALHVTRDLERFRFNTAIAHLRELTHAIESHRPYCRESVDVLLRLLYPIAPHISSELWSHHHTSLLSALPWFEVDTTLLEEKTFTVVVQVNGKRKATLRLPSLSEKALREHALQDDSVRRVLGDRPIKKTIVIPNRVINFVL